MADSFTKGPQICLPLIQPVQTSKLLYPNRDIRRRAKQRTPSTLRRRGPCQILRLRGCCISRQQSLYFLFARSACTQCKYSVRNRHVEDQVWRYASERVSHFRVMCMFLNWPRSIQERTSEKRKKFPNLLSHCMTYWRCEYRTRPSVMHLIPPIRQGAIRIGQTSFQLLSLELQ